MPSRRDIQTLIDGKRRRLQKLKEQEAVFGLSTDPATLIQIEDLEQELRELETQLAQAPDSAEPVERSSSSATTGQVYHINTGGGAVITGQVQTGGGDFVGRDQVKTTGLSATEVATLFGTVYQEIAGHPGLSDQDKADLKAEVEEVQAMVAKPEAEVDESLLSRRLRNIKRMAPDILEVVATILTNPAAGFGFIVNKTAEKIQVSAAE